MISLRFCFEAAFEARKASMTRAPLGSFAVSTVYSGFIEVKLVMYGCISS